MDTHTHSLPKNAWTYHLCMWPQVRHYVSYIAPSSKLTHTVGITNSISSLTLSLPIQAPFANSLGCSDCSRSESKRVSSSAMCLASMSRNVWKNGRTGGSGLGCTLTRTNTRTMQISPVPYVLIGHKTKSYFYKILQSRRLFSHSSEFALAHTVRWDAGTIKSQTTWQLLLVQLGTWTIWNAISWMCFHGSELRPHAWH